MMLGSTINAHHVFRYHYVYTLMGHDGPDVYAKIGMTQALHRRLHDLLEECPSPPAYVAFIEIQSKRRARILERILHIAMNKWLVQGEWFRFPHAEKAEVNRASQAVLKMLSAGSCKPLRWVRLKDVSALKEHYQLRKRA
jgi:hypothetical protein